jgi:hypothetical protein
VKQEGSQFDIRFADQAIKDPLNRLNSIQQTYKGTLLPFLCKMLTRASSGIQLMHQTKLEIILIDTHLAPRPFHCLIHIQKRDIGDLKTSSMKKTQPLEEPLSRSVQKNKILGVLQVSREVRRILSQQQCSFEVNLEQFRTAS